MSAVMNTVYNHYLTSYGPKSVTRYDTHKKSELRSVYNSIVKINKESPWYLPVTKKDTQAYAVTLKENARALHNTIASLGGLEDSGVLNKKTAYTTDEEVATANFVGRTSPGGASPTFSLEVLSLATPQENLGEFLGGGKIGLAPDTYSFDVSINDMNYEFQFAVGESESNQEVQERLIRLINNSEIGLKADLVESEGRTSLRLRSENPGLPEAQDTVFTVSDGHTSKTAGTVEYFGLDYTSRPATNASFLLNGEPRTATSNHFTVGKQFEVQLNGISAEGQPLTIGLKTDVESLTDNVSSLANGYNDFVKTTADFIQAQPRSSRLVNEVGGIAYRYHEALGSMGLSLKENGLLEVNREQLTKTAQDAGDLNLAFGALKEFTGMLLRKSDQVSINPMDYVEQKIVAYKNPKRTFASPYVTSAYSGMMFNGYC